MAQVVWVSETTSPERDRVCDRALDQFGTGAILHSFPKKDVSFPVRNRGSAGVPASQSWEAVSARSERWRKWSGFPRPLPLKEIAFATVHWTNSGRAPSFTLSLRRTFPSRSEIAAPLGSPRRSRGRRFRTEVNDGASGLGFPDHFPRQDGEVGSYVGRSRDGRHDSRFP